METLQDIKQTVILSAPIEKVWKTVSTSEGIEAWFMPNDFKAELGYEFHIQSPFGPSPCKVTELDEPNRLSFKWDTDGWFVSFLLKDLGGKTEFTLIHGGWKQSDELVEKAQAESAVIRERMSHGWTGILAKLGKVVEE
ncbi:MULTISPECIES: SRPBCC family protein [Cytobacillus]|uniref:SRPBCC family protein n=1 Tax=Cytobacillus TaxID=2675230 RepID=UPI00203A6D6D|nr:MULTISPECIES: SRPBCC domain-containing protein [Cytobacillus]MBY0155119.1 SRPBCC domain-containing protein [Cytobacillus firmus]MCM3245351.1 SRPBCC domain-containing protein [Cytobacillus oceanisediminis]MCM3393417.1 SRPBCC domain-containing protein [Cytobacillus oceanisediminis]MCM3530515.1 SRPBCC domain-containing protein [Cytobacillus oceanisediminis]MCS0824223.1 SRPBCC domain-containing protein [Cytobacillus firmus]